MFKDSLCFEDYLVNLDAFDRFSLCKFRCCSINLPAYANRFNNVPFTDLLCPLCCSRDVGDEFHYLFKCEFFNEERKKYCKFSSKCANSYSFKSLLATNNHKQLKSICKFIHIIASTFKTSYKYSSVDSSISHVKSCVVTKSGRSVIRPVKLDL